jgi:competence protein ComEA
MDVSKMMTLNHKTTALLTGATLIFGATLLTTVAHARQDPQTPKPAATQASTEAQANDEAWADEAEALATKVCVQCHPIENITKQRHTPREWSDLVTTMATLGAQANEEQLALIKKYLVRYYGLVRINTATAEEISAVLGFTPKEAAAVVDYRKAHGNFADAAALAKVEGLDKAKLEEQPDAIRYDPAK